MARFEKGNSVGVQFEEKWTLEEAQKAFNVMYENAQIDSEILCLQDAYMAFPMRGSTFHYLIEKFPSLEKYKKDIQDVVISRINKGALRGDYVSTPAIWRQKQLGERDTQYQETKHSGELKTEPPRFIFTDLSKLDG